MDKNKINGILHIICVGCGIVCTELFATDGKIGLAIAWGVISIMQAVNAYMELK